MLTTTFRGSPRPLRRNRQRPADTFRLPDNRSDRTSGGADGAESGPERLRQLAVAAGRLAGDPAEPERMQVADPICPSGLRCYELDARETALETLPDDLHVEYKLDLSGCTALRELPAGLKVGSLILTGCTALTAPAGRSGRLLSGHLRLCPAPVLAAAGRRSHRATECARLRPVNRRCPPG